MAPNARVVKWLISLYRGVLRRQWVENVKHSAEYVVHTAAVRTAEAVRARPHIEQLEPRVMLSADTLFDVTKATYVGNPTLTGGVRTALVDGLTAIKTKLQALSTSGALAATDVPGILFYDGSHPGKALNLADIMGNVSGAGFASVIQNHLINEVSGTSLGSTLSSLNFSDSGAVSFLSTKEYTVAITNAGLHLIAGNNYEVTFDVTLSVTDDGGSGLHFDLGRNADALGVRSTNPLTTIPNFTNEVEVRGGLSIDFTAGVNVTITEGDFDGQADTADTKVDVVNGDNDFWMKNGDIAGTVHIDTTGETHTAGAMQIGFLDVDLTLDHYKLDGVLNLQLNSHAKTFFANISAITATVDAPTGLIDAQVDISVDPKANLGNAFLNPPHSYQINFSGSPLGPDVSSIPLSNDPRTAPHLSFNSNAKNDIAPFKNVAAGDILSLLKGFSDRLASLPASSVLNLPLPFSKGMTLGQILPIGTMFNNKLIFDAITKTAKLVDDKGNPLFSSAQTLTNVLASLTGVSAGTINPTYLLEENSNPAHKLLFTLGFDLPFDPALIASLASSQIGFNIPLGSIGGLKAGATIQITPTGHIGFTFGVDLKAATPASVAISTPLGNSTIRAVLDSATGNVQTPANGQLTQTAKFRLTVGGSFGGAFDITITAADTAANANRTDLKNLLQTKINAAIDAIPNLHSQPVAGHNLVTVGLLDDGRLTLTSEFSTFLSVKKLVGDTGGFATQLGFQDIATGQLASSAPTPGNGVLASTANFDLLLGNGTSGTLLYNVHVNNTHGNTGVADLVADIHAALVAAGVDTNKLDVKQLGGTGTIVLFAKDPIVNMIQIKNPDAIIRRDLGWQDKQIGASIALSGNNDLEVKTEGTGPLDGKPGSDVTFKVSINGGAFVDVNVLLNPIAPDPNYNSDPNASPGNPSKTSDNSTLADLVADINAALSVAKLPDGRTLGTLVTAGFLDTNLDDTPDTIIFRTTSPSVNAFSIKDGANSNLIHITSTHAGVHIGPNVTTGGLPAGVKFTLTLSDHTPQTLTVGVVDHTGATDPIAALVQDLQAQINANSDLNGNVFVGRQGGRIVFAVPDQNFGELRISSAGTTSEALALGDILGFQDGQFARSDDAIAFFIQDAQLKVGGEVKVVNASASANIGFVGINVNDIDADLKLDLTLGLKDNQNNSSRIFLNNLGSNLLNLVFTGGVLPANGHTGAGVTFDVTINGSTHTITILQTATNTNTTRADLIVDIQAALDSALGGTGARVVASLNQANQLVLSVSALYAKSFQLSNISAQAATDLGLAIGTQYSFLDTPTAHWSGSASFGNITIPNPIPGLDSFAPFTINLGVADDSLAGNIDLTPDLSVLPADLLKFANLLFSGGSGVLDAIKGLGDFLNPDFINSLPFLGQKIPVINQSIADLLNLGTDFQKVIAAFAGNPTQTIQALKSKILEALSLPSADPQNLVNVAFNTTSKVLELKLRFDKSFVKTLPIDFDLNLPFDLKGNAFLEAEGEAQATLAVGIDLTNPLAPKLFLNTNDTNVKLNFAARGKGLNFTASLGPVGLFITDGSLAIDADGLVGTTNDPLDFTVNLTDGDGTNDGRVDFLHLGDIGVTTPGLVGKVNATLPIFFPTDADFLGNLGLQIDDLQAFLGGDLSTLHVQVPDLSNLLTNLHFNLIDNIPLLIEGVDFIFAKLQGLLDDGLGKLNLPLVGKGIKDAVQFINAIRSTVFQGLKDQFAAAENKSENVITNALFDLMHNKLNILKHFNTNDPNATASLSDIQVDKSLTGDTATDHVEWRMRLGQIATKDIAFDLGLPVLGLKSNSPLTISANWNVNLGFGLDFEHGFYFILNVDDPTTGTTNDSELSANISLDLPDFSGNLLFLHIDATDTHPGDDLTASFGVNIDNSSGADPDKVTLGELLNIGVTPSLTGDANVKLKLRAGIGGGTASGKLIAALPSIVADFELRAGIDLLNSNPGNGNSAFHLDYVAFKNIGLDLGSFFSDFLKPVISAIQDVTGPLQPFIDVFTAPIPVISDLAGQPVTLLDIAALFGDVDPGMLEAIANIITMVNSIPTDIPAGGLVIPFGNVTLVDTSVGGGAGDLDLFNEHAFDSLQDPNTPLSGIGHFGDALGSFGGLGDAFDNAVDLNGDTTTPPADVKTFTEGLGNQSFGDFIKFPFLTDPSQILGALFGRPFTIVTVDLPAFSFGFSYSQFFPIIGPLGASITGSLGARFKFGFGYDSLGLQKFAEGDFKHPLDLFRGFYVSDRANADGTGADVNEVEITGSLIGSAELNLGVAKGSVGGGVKVTFGLNLNDPDNDGKVRIAELINNIVYAVPPFNPLGIFDLNIKVEAFLTWAIEVLFVFKASGTIGPSLPLLDLTIPLPHDPVLATKVDDDTGTLRLDAGAFAADRLNVNVDDGDEDFTITQTADHEVDVTAFGVTQHYTGVNHIEAKGGAGNDTFTFKHTGGNFHIDLLVDGGSGDDHIDFDEWIGEGNVTGGTGNDKICGGLADDVIDGGDGQDNLTGGGGNDLIKGGNGNDTISGDDGNDVLFGEAGADKIGGGSGDDYVSGGIGNDEIHGDATFDCDGVFADATADGNDVLSGDEDKDSIIGDGGDDKIGGGAAADLLEGGLGADTIYGDSIYVIDAAGNITVGTTKVSLLAALPQTEGGDVIYGESKTAPLTGPSTDGGDTIFGEAGNDFIRGNGGNDNIFGGTGADIAFGDQGNDHAEGGDGADIVFGGAGNDTVLGQNDSDILFGDDGLVVYFGYPAFTGQQGDQIVAGNRLIGDGNPALVPLAAAFDTDPVSRDYIVTDVNVATDGDDVIEGAAGSDIGFGGAGNDRVTGDADPEAVGFDPAKAPTGKDILFGDGGEVLYNNHFFTKVATVTPTAGGNDTMYGNNGDDIEFGGAGNDEIHGGNGASFSTIGSDKDILVGDNGEIDFTGGKATTAKTTNEGVGGTDTIGGNEDDDIAFGGANDDTVGGDLANDVLIGDEGQVDMTNDDDGRHYTVIQSTDTAEATGGIDTVNGDDGDDVVIGGVKGDLLNGNLGKDIILGDEGKLQYNSGPDSDIDTLDRVETTKFNLGGNDKITGADDNDIAMGGSGADNIKGDAPLDDPGDDILIGDQGLVTFFNGNVTLIKTTDTVDADGDVDTINGNEGKDVILGGVAGDILNGNDGNDIILGDEGQLVFDLSSGMGGDDNALTVDIIETLQPAFGGSDIIQGNAGGDIAFGGAKGDFVYGDADSPVGALDGNDTLFGDGGRISLLNGIIWKIESTDTAIGGKDYMEGNAANDIMIGGADKDEMHGDAGVAGDVNAFLDGNDIMLGDNGLLNWLYHGNPAYAGTIEAGFVFDNNIATLDLITTIAPNDGDKDMMFGNAGNDVIFGGTNADLLVGDNTKGAVGSEAFGLASARPGSDLEFGDHGRLYPQHSFLMNFNSRNFFSIDIGFASGGAGDYMFGNESDDVMIGGQGDDRMFGNSGDDDMIGGHNVSTTTGVDKAIDEFEKPLGNTVNDYMDGGTGNDAMAGDNAQIWRNGSAIQANDLRLRFRTLAGALLYKADGTPNITAVGQNDPRTTTKRSIILLDHTLGIQNADAASNIGSRYGNDIMAGNAGDDAMYGQLGSDTLLGDGNIDPITLDVQTFEGVTPAGVVTDGHDYIEGNGGSDLIMGGLGQDDIIGGSSKFFGLTTGNMRPDAGDIIFGGAGLAERVKRHAFSGDVAGDQITFAAGLANRHGVDSDFIMGDNANIYRTVINSGTTTAFVQFNYDLTSVYENRGTCRIVVRSYEFLDYSPIEAVTTSLGAGDVIHGESGDDFIHGMTGEDLLYGDAENDEMFGERARDWMSGGTGDDAMLGDNGLVFTSRNSIAEPLYGVTPTTQQYISEPGDFLQYLLNQNGILKHTVDLEPFDQGADDVMYGGLGDDNMHGGEGNDGISGAEALPAFYNSPLTSPHVVVADLPEDRFVEPRIVPIDGNGVTTIGFYDKVNALPKLANFFLNFENDLSLKVTIGTHFDPNHGDGKDFIFGDWGSDWLVGGTGRDHMYGGMGNDLLNMDDDLETDGGANDQPDFGNLIPGDPGAPAKVYDNSDFAYGGGGRDVLILNTGADRAEDWVGEYNSFIAPFAPFGNGQVERQVPPSTYEFFYQMSSSDGADQTRLGALAQPPGASGDPARNGEPYGEMGLITQKDKQAPFDWASQNGAPTDKQAGNTPGGKRDTRGDGLSGGTTNSSAVTSPTFVVDLPLLQVVKLSFWYWASTTTGLTNQTLSTVSSNAPVLLGQSFNNAIVFKTQKLITDEYRWIYVAFP